LNSPVQANKSKARVDSF